MKPITLLTDYGYEDEFAGACRAVIERVAPGAVVIDITHGIPPQDVRRGALALAAALPYGPEAVHVAVVDPGVGTSRRPLAVAVAGSGHVLVGPDNGLLSPALDALGGAGEAVDLTDSGFRLEPVSATFHGRDIFAPVAARLALGASLADAGEPIDPGTLARLAERRVVVGDDHVAAHVAYFDHFGNALLDLAAGQVPDGLLAPGSSVVVEGGGSSHDALAGRTFADAPAGGVVVYANSVGRLAVAVNRGSARERLGIGVDDQLLIRVP
ncbi:MAG TPA: SAM-dependent chlorinase/fluorinase [Solirubrobacterales bacterium]